MKLPAHLLQGNGVHHRQLRTASPTVMALYTRFVQTSSDRVRERLAEGMWHKHMLDKLLRLRDKAIIERETNMEAADVAEPGIVAAASEQPADRAEAVLPA